MSDEERTPAPESAHADEAGDRPEHPAAGTSKKTDDSGFFRSFRPDAEKARSNAWWNTVDPDGSRSASVHIDPALADSARQLTVLANTHRLPRPKPPAAARSVIDMIARKSISIEALTRAVLDDHALRKHFVPHVEDLSAEAAHDAVVAALHEVGPGMAVREVLFLAARAVCFGGNTADHPFAEEQWEHAFATAVAADGVARAFHFGMPVLAFTAGLFHDLAKMPMLWAAARMAAKHDMPVPDADTVFRLCEPAHEEAAADLGAFWKLPSPVVKVMASHHDEELSRDDRLAALRAIVQIADRIAVRSGHGSEPRLAKVPVVESTPAVFLGLSAQNAAERIGDLPVTIVERFFV